MTLEDAQRRKVEILLDRLELKAGDRLFEIGCGWGSLAIGAAKRGATVLGLTLSKEQKAWAEEKVREANLATRLRSDCRITANSRAVRCRRLGRDG